MSEFHNAFYVTCKKHDVEHPKWRKCPKCEEIITYSEEEVYKLISEFRNDIYDGEDERLGFDPEYFESWFNNNKKKID